MPAQDPSGPGRPVPSSAAGSPDAGLVDSHCHLLDPAFAADRSAVLERARAAGIRHVVIIGENPERAEAAWALACATAGISATAGLHPHEASRWSPDVAAWLATAVARAEIVAVGETGLDYHYDFSPREEQRAAFEAHLDLAARARKPAVVHARQADADVAAVLRNQPDAVAILHSFSGGTDLLRLALALGHYIGVSGMITFRNWDAEEQVRAIPLDRLLVETDAPFLAPVPHRGRRNEPAYLVHTAARLATLLGQDPHEVAAQTTANAARAFGPRIQFQLQPQEVT